MFLHRYQQVFQKEGGQFCAVVQIRLGIHLTGLLAHGTFAGTPKVRQFTRAEALDQQQCHVLFCLRQLSANPNSPWYLFDAEPGWHVDVGVGIEREPTYAGSSRYIKEADGTARAIYRSRRGDRYFVSIGEIGAVAALSPTLQALAFLEYEDGRSDEEDATLGGLDEIEATIEGQFMLTRRFGNASLFGILQPDVTGDAQKGLVWFLGAGYDILSPGGRWRMGTTFDISGADSEYMRTEFGISQAESERTDFPVFQPDAGLKSLTWSLDAEYYLSGHLSLLGSLEVERYLADSVDSPLIADEGSELTSEANVMLRYRF